MKNIIKRFRKLLWIAELERKCPSIVHEGKLRKAYKVEWTREYCIYIMLLQRLEDCIFEYKKKIQEYYDQVQWL